MDRWYRWLYSIHHHSEHHRYFGAHFQQCRQGSVIKRKIVCLYILYLHTLIKEVYPTNHADVLLNIFVETSLEYQRAHMDNLNQVSFVIFTHKPSQKTCNKLPSGKRFHSLCFLSRILGSSSFESQKIGPSISVTSPMSPGMLRDSPQYLSGQLSVSTHNIFWCSFGASFDFFCILWLVSWGFKRYDWEDVSVLLGDRRYEGSIKSLKFDNKGTMYFGATDSRQMQQS